MYKGVISVHWHVNLKQKEEIRPETDNRDGPACKEDGRGLEGFVRQFFVSIAIEC